MVNIECKMLLDDVITAAVFFFCNILYSYIGLHNDKLDTSRVMIREMTWADQKTTSYI